MSFPLDAGQQIALDDAFQKILKEKGVTNGLPFSLSSALSSSGGSITPSAVIAALAGQDLTSLNSLTITNTNDASTATFNLPFGEAFLELNFTNGQASQGLVVNGNLYINGDGTHTGSLNVSSGDPDPTGASSGTFGWASGQSLYENATGVLSTQYIGTTSGLAVGYTGSSVPAKHFYVDPTGTATSVNGFKSTSTLVGGASLTNFASFDATGNPATSSPALANFGAPLEIGGRYYSSLSDGAACVYIGALGDKTAGPILQVLNNYGTRLGGAEVPVMTVDWNGATHIGAGLDVGGRDASLGRITNAGASLYLQSAGTHVHYKTSGSGNLVDWYNPASSNTASLTDAGQIQVSSLGVGNSAAASVAVGTLVKKIEIFDRAGTSLGFIPVYSSIT